MARSVAYLRSSRATHFFPRADNQWRKTVNLPVATAGASLSQVGSRLILVGGERATGLPSAEAYTAANAGE